MQFREKVSSKASGIITYGITPPKISNTEQKITEISAKQIERIQSIGIDALVLYDLQDEKDRIEDERPFPFLPTLDPIDYASNYLSGLRVPRIIYRCTAKYSAAEFISGIRRIGAADSLVFVGASAPNQKVQMSLDQAYNLSASIDMDLSLGGVVIPERHTLLGDEHHRVAAKEQKGCSFFISQAVYNLVAAKNFLSDYYYHCKSNGKEVSPVIFTLAPCGSAKTLEFMKWLGISFPKWLENDLLYSNDILARSVDICIEIAKALYIYAQEKNIPVGFNVESVSIRKVEIEASIDMVNRIKREIFSA
jgi:hypothetical protein